MSQDRREKIQDMLLARIEELFTKYDDGKSHEGVLDNAQALERIAQAMQAVGHPSREIAVGTYAARPVDSDSEKLTRSEGLIAWDAAKPDIDTGDLEAMESVGIRLVSDRRKPDSLATCDRYVSPQVAAELAPLLEERRELRRLVQNMLGCDRNTDLIAALKIRLSETPPPPLEPPA